jgi:hypothetical protein
MRTLFDSNTELTGASPWVIGDFSVVHNSVKIQAFGLGSDDLICVKQIVKKQVDSGSFELDECGISFPEPLVIQASQYLKHKCKKVCICDKQPWLAVIPPGDYQLEVSGTNIAAKTVLIQLIEYQGTAPESAVDQTSCCEPI